MSVSREAIEHAIAKWERRAKSEMYLDDFLHPKARAWLIEELLLTQHLSGDKWSADEVAMFKARHAQSAAESSEVEQSRVESTQMLMAGKRDPAVADINDISPRRKKGH